MKTTTVQTASVSVMAAALLAIFITSILKHYEIVVDDTTVATFVAVVGPLLHVVFVKWGVEPSDAAQPQPVQTPPSQAPPAA